MASHNHLPVLHVVDSATRGAECFTAIIGVRLWLDSDALLCFGAVPAFLLCVFTPRHPTAYRLIVSATLDPILSYSQRVSLRFCPSQSNSKNFELMVVLFARRRS